jgi:hypothetical protein
MLTCERLAIGQGVFYLTTGLWPVFNLRSFEAVTGPKYDGWLVKTVGLLIGVSGAAMLSAGLRKRVTPEISLLASGEALSLGSVSLIYSLRGRISKIYLLDTIVEYALVGAWVLPSGVGFASSARDMLKDPDDARSVNQPEFLPLHAAERPA